MSTLDSSSTLAEIQAAYADNASYAEDSSVSKAKGFITACRLLILKLPKSSAAGHVSTTLSPELLRDEIKDAQSWLAIHDDSNQANPGVTHMGFAEYRE